MTDLAPDAGASPVTATVPRRPFSVGGRFARWEWLAFGGIAVVYLVVTVTAIYRGPPLGWDESVYTLRARDFAAGVPSGSYWNAYRAPGLPWLGHLLWVAGREATVLRLLVAGIGLGLVVTVWLLARHLFGSRAGLIAAGGIAVTPPLMLAASQVWPDIPGAAVGLLAIGLFVFATGGERPSWWMLLTVPAVGAATYFRFGAPLPIAIGLLGVAVWRRRVLFRGWVPVAATAVGATAAVVAVLEIPWLTGGGGAPLGAIGGAGRVWFSGFADYAGLAHEVVAPAAVVLALAGMVAGLGRAGRRDVDRGAVITVVGIAAVTAAAIATVLHGEVRYLAPVYPWLWIAGAPGLEGLAGALPGKMRPALVLVLGLVLSVAMIGLARERNRDNGHAHGALRKAAEAIAEQSGDRPCLVVTRRVPQVMWYAGCEARLFNRKRVSLPSWPEGPVFVLFSEGDPYEPAGALRQAYLAALGEPWLVVEGQRDATVYLVGEPPEGG
ncbi:MAG: glycosyltransferase family 39 protein [Actinomycetota bacterium]